MLKDDATPYDQASASDWLTQTYSYNWLRKRAADRADMAGAMTFLKSIGVVPEGETYRRTNIPGSVAAPHSSAIPGRYLAEFANDWDSDGPSSPVDFIEALEFECAGTEKRDVVSDLLADLGATIQSESALDSALAA